jgi:hypothetical protein
MKSELPRARKVMVRCCAMSFMYCACWCSRVSSGYCVLYCVCSCAMRCVFWSFRTLVPRVYGIRNERCLLYCFFGLGRAPRAIMGSEQNISYFLLLCDYLFLERPRAMRLSACRCRGFWLECFEAREDVEPCLFLVLFGLIRLMEIDCALID